MPASKFIEGMKIPFVGWRYLRRHRLVARFAALPIAVNSGLTLFFLATAIYGAVELATRVAFAPGWLGGALKVAFYLASAFAVVTLTAGLALLTSALVLSAVHVALAERIEKDLGVSEGELSPVTLWPEASDSLKNLAAWGGIQLALLVLNWAPGPGTLGAAIGSWYFGAFFLGLEAMDLPLALRGMRRPAKVAFARQHLPETLGLGTVLLSVSGIPGIGAVAMIAAVAGSVVWYRVVKPIR